MEYRTQTFLGPLQCLVVIMGTLFVALANKPLDESFLETIHLPGIPGNHGVWLLIVPPMWVAATILAERSSFRWANKGLTAVTGSAILIGLAWLFGYAVLLPCRMSLGSN